MSWGIFEFKVGDIPRQLPSGSDEPVLYQYKVYPLPDDDNYAHSEVSAHREGSYSPRLKVSEGVKKQFRTILSNRLRILKFPETD